MSYNEKGMVKLFRKVVLLETDETVPQYLEKIKCVSAICVLFLLLHSNYSIWIYCT
jgi:hypothetical protein